MHTAREAFVLLLRFSAAVCYHVQNTHLQLRLFSLLFAAPPLLPPAFSTLMSRNQQSEISQSAGLVGQSAARIAIFSQLHGLPDIFGCQRQPVAKAADCCTYRLWSARLFIASIFGDPTTFLLCAQVCQRGRAHIFRYLADLAEGREPMSPLKQTEEVGWPASISRRRPVL